MEESVRSATGTATATTAANEATAINHGLLILAWRGLNGAERPMRSSTLPRSRLLSASTVLGRIGALE